MLSAILLFTFGYISYTFIDKTNKENEFSEKDRKAIAKIKERVSNENPKDVADRLNTTILS